MMQTKICIECQMKIDCNLMQHQYFAIWCSQRCGVGRRIQSLWDERYIIKFQKPNYFLFYFCICPLHFKTKTGDDISIKFFFSSNIPRNYMLSLKMHFAPKSCRWKTIVQNQMFNIALFSYFYDLGWVTA